MKIDNLFYNIGNVLTAILLLVSSMHSISSIATPSLMIGTIQFPLSIQTIPIIRIYSCGKKIPFQLCEIDQDAKQFIFRIPQIIQHSQCYILITQKIQFESRPHKNQQLANNTINYLKVPPHQPYIFYELTLTETKDKQDKTVSSWIVEQKTLDPLTNQIPDETIIVCYDPSYVDSLKTLSGENSAFTIPTITLKPNLIALLGSEDELQKSSTRMLIAAIDPDTVHATIKPKYQQKFGQKSHVTLVAPVT